MDLRLKGAGLYWKEKEESTGCGGKLGDPAASLSSFKWSASAWKW